MPARTHKHTDTDTDTDTDRHTYTHGLSFIADHKYALLRLSV